ncbi:invasion protein [Pseudomonas sp. PCH199]|uniref:SpaN/EivJ family type III secretion system needle length determinant n=1 Tax=unclassified Pseudomonas TaxID=196821 RepID=UPI000BDC5BB4|nr:MULTISPECIES: invasion protein [unclassified Pseudomonas]MCW8277086.1 invasion protein [Pseudomonas sp. PCH199]PAM82584.1 invasion protein [Pseudomonas sp. ERMR1:02]
MKHVSVISPGPVQTTDPGTEGSVDELQDTLVPVQEDELPQGVLELMATLILRHQPAVETGRAVAWQSMASDQGTADVERDEAQPTASVRVSFAQAGPLFSKPLHHPLSQQMALAAPAIDRVTTPAYLNPHPALAVEPALIERPSNTVEPLPVDRAANTSVASAPTFDAQLPQALTSLQTVRHAPPITRSAAPAPAPAPAIATLQPLPVPDVMPETLTGPDRGLLQVPFNNGAASGQVTISRGADESPRNLLLSPSNALVFDQLKTPFELIRDPGWQLTDNDGEQQRQGSHQSPDEEQAEQQDLPA